MPISFKIAKHHAEKVQLRGANPEKPTALAAEGVLRSIWDSKDASCKEMLQSSLEPKPEFIAQKNGFIHSATSAYNSHHDLIVRPDDIWIAILSQFNLFVNAHAEELRSKFVAHEGKKKLVVKDIGNRYTVDFGRLATRMTYLIKQNILDPSLQEWILPSYTTTTTSDTVVCSVMMMSTLKAYFDYVFSLACGIPSITLLGEKQDYEIILQKLDKLKEFGAEPTAFARLLKPILEQFVSAFDVVAQGGTPDDHFWGRICHTHRGGSGPSYLSGWLTAFCCWNKDGKWQGPDLNELESVDSVKTKTRTWGPPPPLVYEGLRYPVIKTTNIPQGFCEVDVLLEDNGEEFDCIMIAGHVGSVASGKDKLDTLQPASEWFMFIKGDARL